MLLAECDERQTENADYMKHCILIHLRPNPMQKVKGGSRSAGQTATSGTLVTRIRNSPEYRKGPICIAQMPAQLYYLRYFLHNRRAD
jgi:hypothetical protein